MIVVWCGVVWCRQMKRRGAQWRDGNEEARHSSSALMELVTRSRGHGRRWLPTFLTDMKYATRTRDGTRRLPQQSLPLRIPRRNDLVGFFEPHPRDAKISSSTPVRKQDVMFHQSLIEHTLKPCARCSGSMAEREVRWCFAPPHARHVHETF